MSKNYNQSLPKECFSEFQVLRLKRPQTIWSNDKLKYQREDFHYCIPHPHDSNDSFHKESSTYFADRYGGRGVGRNGGSARCGELGGVQIKGIGRTPLAGRSTDFKHSHGGATVYEAITEAIWGEICAMVLPFGAIRVHEIVSTSTLTYDGKDESFLTPRALIYRQASIRPAHFMRAENFDPSDEFWLSQIGDPARTKAAILSLDSIFFSIFDLQAKRWCSESVNACLIQCAIRYARQIARAKARRIPHGSLNCSNICLDGRYIDFGTMTSIDDYGRLIVSGANPDLWREEENIERMLSNLIFYILNFSPLGPMQLITEKKLLDIFRQELRSRLCIEFIMLCGFSPAEISLTQPENIANFWKCLVNIMRTGNGETFFLENRLSYPHGEFGLNQILCYASASDCEQELYRLLDRKFPNKDFSAFVLQYWKLRRDIFGTHENPKRRKNLLTSALRLNATLDYLEKPSLHKEFLAEDHDTLKFKINSVIKKATIQLRDVKEDDEESISDQGILDRNYIFQLIENREYVR
jgi:hypothetical protein